ncbi:MAG: thioredoxin family protein [Armatimonadota bacterium]
MKKIALLLVILFAGAMFLTSCMKKDEPAEAKAGKVKWYYSFDKGQTEAKKLNKPMMVDFYTDWCSWCKKLDKNVYTDPKVQTLAQRFVCIKIDADKNELLKQKYNIKGYPTVLILSPDGALITTILGYREPAAFAAALKQGLK